MYVFRVFLVALALPAAVAVAAAADFSAALAARVQADDNVFLQNDAPLAAGQTRAALPAHAGDVVADLGLNLGLKWKLGPALALGASYAPEIFRYSRHSSENHTDHRLGLAAIGAADGWQYETRASLLLTDGSRDSPVFNRLGGAPSIGGEPVRARRAQDLLKVNGRLTRVWAGGFVRGVLAGYEQDFHTRERAIPGYANYVDRSEWSGGADLGWNVRPGLALVAGARYGRQRQANLFGVPLNYTNTFTRWLAGVEGAVAPGWKFSLLAGPDVRRFGSAVYANFDRRQRTAYWEGAVAWEPRPADTLAFTAKHYLWLSSAGRGAYLDTVYDLAWNHRFGPAWSLTAGANYHTGNAAHYNSVPRHDAIYTGRVALARTLGLHTKLEVSLLHDWGESFVPRTPGREYRRWLSTLGVAHAW